MSVEQVQSCSTYIAENVNSTYKSVFASLSEKLASAKITNEQYGRDLLALFGYRTDVLEKLLPLIQDSNVKNLFESRIRSYPAYKASPKSSSKPSDSTSSSPAANQDQAGAFPAKDLSSTMKQFLSNTKLYFGKDDKSFTRLVSLVDAYRHEKLSLTEIAYLIANLFITQPKYIKHFSQCITKQDHRPHLLRFHKALENALPTFRSSRFDQNDFLTELVNLAIDYQIPEQSSPTWALVIESCRGLMPDLDLPPTNTRLLSDAPPAVSSAVASAISKRDGSGKDKGPDASHGKRSGTSYVERPQHPKCSGRDELGNSVLNDTFLCVPSGREGSHHEAVSNPQEETLFVVEDDQLDIDIQIGRAQSTYEKLLFIQTELQKMPKPDSTIPETQDSTATSQRAASVLIDQSLSPLNILIIKTVCKDRTNLGIDPITQLKLDPMKYIGEMAMRCRYFADENAKARRALGLVWKQVFAKNYVKTLDRRQYVTKKQDKKATNPKIILARLKAKHFQFLTAGKLPDYHMKLDFKHFSLASDPPLVNTKSMRRVFPKEYNRQVSKTSTVHDHYLVSEIPYSLTDENLKTIKSIMIDLVCFAIEKSHGPEAQTDLKNWLENTFSFIIEPPPFVPQPRSTSTSTANMSLFYGPQEFYTLLQVWWELHSRLRSALKLSVLFDSSCWDFSAVKVPQQNENTELELSLVYAEREQQQQLAKSTNGMDISMNPATPTPTPSAYPFWAPPVSHATIIPQLHNVAETIRTNSWSNILTGNIRSPSMDDMNSASGETQSFATPYIHTAPSEKIDTLVGGIKSCIRGRLDQSNYEEMCLTMFGLDAYPLYSIPRLVPIVTAQIQTMMTTRNRKDWYQAYATYRKATAQLLSKPPVMVDSRLRLLREDYLKAATEIAQDTPFIEFKMNAFSTMFIRMISNAGNFKFFKSDVWKSYITSFLNSSSEGYSVQSRTIFLPRNIRSQLPQHLQYEDLDQAHPSWELSTNLSKIGYRMATSSSIKGSIDRESSHIIFENGTADSMVRIGRQVTKTVSPHGGAQIHAVCDAISKIKSDFPQIPMLADLESKLQWILTNEATREDVVDAPAKVVELPSNRTRARSGGKGKAEEVPESSSESSSPEEDEDETGTSAKDSGDLNEPEPAEIIMDISALNGDNMDIDS